MENIKQLSLHFRILYLSILFIVVIGIAFLQGYLAYNSETDLINIQIGQSCNAIFDAVDAGWTEVKLFTETISGGFYADYLEFTQDHYRRLANTSAVQSVEAMTSLQFVKHLKDYQARLDNGIQSGTESNNFIIVQFAIWFYKDSCCHC